MSISFLEEYRQHWRDATDNHKFFNDKMKAYLDRVKKAKDSGCVVISGEVECEQDS